MSKKFKVGDKVFEGFERSEITKMEGKRVTELHQGCVSLSGNDLRVAPYSEENALFAAWVESQYQLLRKLHGSSGLNWPTIHSLFGTICHNVMVPGDEDEEDEVRATGRRRIAQSVITQIVDEVTKATKAYSKAGNFRIFY